MEKIGVGVDKVLDALQQLFVIFASQLRGDLLLDHGLPLLAVRDQLLFAPEQPVPLHDAVNAILQELQRIRSGRR